MNLADFLWNLQIDKNILKSYIHLQALPDNNIARQCLQLNGHAWENSIGDATKS